VSLIRGFSPIANLLLVGATLEREKRQNPEEGLPLAEVALQAISDQPFLRGTKDIAEAITSPGGLEKKVGNIAGSFVPAIASDVAEAIDPQQRETRGEGILAPTQKRIPILREDLPPSIDVLGRPKEDLGLVQSLIDPTRATTDITQENPLLGELVRLDMGISPLKPRKDESSEAYQQRVRDFGQLFQRYGQMLLASPSYQQGSEGTKHELLSRLIERAKRLISEEDQEEASSRLSPQSLLESISRKKDRTK
jgi:hypothetical protein